MTAYYNENEEYAAQWLENLIGAKLIAPGDVDRRSIVDVRADDLRGYTQCHFFAGIGGWSIALRLAGWPDDRPVWTGSCPCQPFSAAGKGKAADDERHLWPAWFPLIAQLRPATVFGEQVEAAVGWGWLDAVFADLEGEGYACGASVLPACGVGAPHIRQRLWFCGLLGDADSEQDDTAESRQSLSSAGCPIGSMADADGQDTIRRSASDGDGVGAAGVPQRAKAGELGHPDQPRPQGRCLQPGEQSGQRVDGAAGVAGSMADARCGSIRDERRELDETPRGMSSSTRQQRLRADDGDGGAIGSFWSDAEWIACTDGKARPVGPGSFPLGHGIRNRASKLRAYGNAIVPQTAAAFIRACVEG